MDEETALERELEMWADKFEAYEREGNSVKDLITKKQTTGMGVRSSSVGNKLQV